VFQIAFLIVGSRHTFAAMREELCRGDHRMKTLTMKWVQFAVLLSALALPAAALSGCNTSKGFGKDVESVGDDIQDEADEAND
jgi:predicted small secreted protein